MRTNELISLETGLEYMVSVLVLCLAFCSFVLARSQPGMEMLLKSWKLVMQWHELGLRREKWLSVPRGLVVCSRWSRQELEGGREKGITLQKWS